MIITAQILDSCAVGATKTKLVKTLNINDRMASWFIDLLLNKELIGAVPGSWIMYETTPKGHSFLKIIQKVRQSLPELG